MQFLLHIDVLAARLRAPETLDDLWANCIAGNLNGWILSSTVSSLSERLSTAPKSESLRAGLKQAIECLSIFPVTAKELRDGLEAPERMDIALAVSCAKALNLDGIVTLDPTAFKNSGATVLEPKQAEALLKTGKPVDSAPLLDVGASYPKIMEAVEASMAPVVRSGKFILGSIVEELEEAVARYCESKYAVGVSSGTDALLISLMAAGIGPGDEVITTPYTFFATAGSIVRTGARPVFVDIDPVTFNIDSAKIEEKLTANTRAIMPVHLYGQSAEMALLLDLARAKNLIVVEDAAQAIGSAYNGKKAGGMGDFGCFSFFPTKNLGGFGDGGMVTVQSEENWDRLKVLRNHGSQPKYFHKTVGGNFRLDALQAAVIQAKLPFLDGWIENRRRNAALYKKLFHEAGLNDRVQTPDEIVAPHTYNQFVVRVGGHRDALRKHLAERRISTEIYYPLCLHMQECFSELGYQEGGFPEAEKAAKETLALPVYPELTERQIEYIVDGVRQFFEKPA